jgi:NAD(P)-dependent dehydrogenase (short-subunit alcohol dehydrogenase family)
MDMKLKGKTAIVTGGTQGIGEAIVRRYAEDGANVAIVARGLDRAQALAEELSAQGVTARGYSADLGNVSQIEPIVAAVAADFGGIDILCNSAGTFLTMPIEETSEADWDAQADLNLKGSFFLVKAVLPRLIARGGGRIVLVSSIAGVRGFPNCAAYCATKAGVVNLTKALALELAPKGININTIAPGNVATPINAHLRGPDQGEYMKLMSDRTPTGRAFLETTDIAGAASFLASDDARGMHGSVVVIDDGWCAW